MRASSPTGGVLINAFENAFRLKTSVRKASQCPNLIPRGALAGRTGVPGTPLTDQDTARAGLSGAPEHFQRARQGRGEGKGSPGPSPDQPRPERETPLYIGFRGGPHPKSPKKLTPQNQKRPAPVKPNFLTTCALGPRGAPNKIALEKVCFDPGCKKMGVQKRIQRSFSDPPLPTLGRPRGAPI